MAPVYITSAELADTLQLTGTSYPEADLSVAIRSASRLIDGLTGQRFYVDEADTTRFFTMPANVWGRPAPTLLDIDPLADLTSFAVDIGGDGTFAETWVADADFVLEPREAQADGVPWTQARAIGRAFTLTHPDSVRIVGRFGWPAVPAEVKSATTILAARLVKRSREAAFGVAAVGVEGNAIRVPRLDNDPDIMALLGHLIRRRPLFA